MYSTTHDFFLHRRRTAPLGRAPLWRAGGALRRSLPRRARRVDGRRRAPLDRLRPPSVDLRPPVGRFGLRARLRRAAAARRGALPPPPAGAAAAPRARPG